MSAARYITKESATTKKTYINSACLDTGKQASCRLPGQKEQQVGTAPDDSTRSCHSNRLHDVPDDMHDCSPQVLVLMVVTVMIMSVTVVVSVATGGSMHMVVRMAVVVRCTFMRVAVGLMSVFVVAVSMVAGSCWLGVVGAAAVGMLLCGAWRADMDSAQFRCRLSLVSVAAPIGRGAVWVTVTVTVAVTVVVATAAASEVHMMVMPQSKQEQQVERYACLLYTSDAADE